MKKAFKNFPSPERGVKGEGFTLAEVLITLMIIGIVAALTIPSVIANYQQQEFKTGLKKAVSVLNEAIQMNIVHEGETPYENISLSNYLKRHMNVISERLLVAPQKSYANRWYSNTSYVSVQNDVFYTADGMRFEIVLSPSIDGNSHVDANGIDHTMHFYLHESGLDAASSKTGRGLQPGEFGRMRDGIYSVNSGFCGSYGLANNPNNTKNTPCVLIVDVNGDKKPNPRMEYLAGQPGSYNGVRYDSTKQDLKNEYSSPSPSDKKFQDIFTIMVTDKEAIPFGVVAQRAMYSK